MEKEKIVEAVRHLHAADSLVVLTGTGMSKESGVPTIQEALDGVWARFDPHQLATPAAFEANPKLVWDWYTYRRELLQHVQPNPGHYAISALEDLVPYVSVVTQNIDGLHELAGSSDVIALHGDIHRYKCSIHCQGDPTPIDLSGLRWDRKIGPPRCPHCRSYIRPDVVWLTEHLPLDLLDRAIGVSTKADVMLVVGSAGLVQPAVSLPYRSKRWNSAYIIEVNPEPGQILSDLFLEGQAGDILPEIIMSMRGLA
jgi:NAD-dependent deacetylase